MTSCRWLNEVGKWFDGASRDPQAVERHVASCAVCTAHWAQLRLLRDGVQAVAGHPEIADAQLPAFMEGIRGATLAPRRTHRGFWAVASACVTALIIASVVFYAFTGGPREVMATEIESYSTELAGATVTTYLAEDGTATVCVFLPREEHNR